MNKDDSNDIDFDDSDFDDVLHHTLDQETATRLDAYNRSEASWRKMVPCQPMPTKLQMHCGFRKSTGEIDEGTLQIINFSTRNAGKSSEYLTFGMLYDIAEMAWCEHEVGFAQGLRIDYFDSNYTIFNDNDILRRELRRAFPEVVIGGFGTIFLHLDNGSGCGGYRRSVIRAMFRTWHRGRFKCNGGMSIKDVVWDKTYSFSKSPA